MAQNPPLLCPNCNTPAPPNQRFCSECGTTLNIGANKPTALASESQFAQAAPPGQNNGSQDATERAPRPGFAPPVAPLSTPPTPQPGMAPGQAPYASGASYSTVPTSGNQFYSQATDANVIPPPPPPDSFVAAHQQSPTPAPGTYVVPDYARAPKRSRGLLIISIVLLLILALGAIGIYALTHRGNQTGNNGTQNTPGANGNTPGTTVTPGATQTSGSGNTPTPGGNGNGAANETVNLMLTYASLDITITSVQYAQSFPDDSSVTSGGVRVAFKESAGPKVGIFAYSDVARLILPDQSVIAPVNEQNGTGPDAGTTRNNWIDFPVTSQPADLSKLMLQMGASGENQMLILLSTSADLSKYQPKTVTPNAMFQYSGVNWTITSATKSLSASGKQATTGNVYITVTLKADNPSSNEFIGYVGDFMRLKSGDTTTSPTSDSTFPTSVPASSSGTTGTVVFLMPQGSTAFTLIMLMQSNPPVNQVTANFQIS
ncbi:MAG: hypothetical protein E6I32_12370 [Chloroflexi bacterium]|nr:MAG: hypothetical protein E6I32_12370 [Chloroflexota bacterium]